MRKVQEGITKNGSLIGTNCIPLRYFSRADAQVFQFFTEDGATQFFSKWTLENGVEIRATIEPDSQDVFLQVQQFRTLPFVVIPLYDACDGCACEENF
jgi:hypothetical protein